MSLHLLAQRLGIATSYTGALGEQVTVPDATIRSVVASLGHDTTGANWIADAQQRLDERAANQLIEPVLVAWDGQFDRAASFTRVRDHHVVLRSELGDDVTQLLASPTALPFGYYHVCVDDLSPSLLISAPQKLEASAERRLCVFAPLYALRPADTTRYADLRELDELVGWAAANGGHGVLTLPLLAGFFDPPAAFSPYSPASRLMWNELYAVVDRPEVDTSGDDIDYELAYAATRQGIERAVSALDDDPFQATEFMRFLAAHPLVSAYARFRAAGERYGRNWRTWPEPLRLGDIPLAEIDPTRVRYHSAAQWLAHTHLADVVSRARAAGITLGLDLAVGTHPDSFDVWANQQSFASGCSIGAPPDIYFPGGQVWGFPPPRPEGARADGHRDLRAALRHHLTVASLLRLDHVMGLLRLFWIPDGASPAEGTYVHAKLDEQLAVICLEAHRSGATIVGENLGLVPGEIDDAMRTHHLLGMTVAFAALETRGTAVRPLTAPPDDLATFGTHDMATFAGFVHGDDLTDQLDLGFGTPAGARFARGRRAEALRAAAAARGVHPDAEALFRATALELASSPAPWMVVALEDLWGERRPQNVPGTSTERPNWRRRVTYPLHGIPPESAELFRQIAAARTGSVRPGDAPS